MKTRHWKTGRAMLVAGLLAMPSLSASVRGGDQPSGVQQAAVQVDSAAPVQPQIVQVEWQPGPPPVAYNGGAYDATTGAYCPPGSSNPYSWHGSRAANRLAWHVVYADARFRTNFLNALGFNRPPCTWKWTHTSVYPADPGYYDPRDGRAYSAQGYGVPMSVPLAPNVKYTYNYGWGVPSSRLTPVGATYQRYNPGSYGAQVAGAPGYAPNPPMVYMPTDTTQQGFYYAHVPAWQPQPRVRWNEIQAVPAGQVIVVPAGKQVPQPLPAAAPPAAVPAAPAAAQAPVNPGIEVPEPKAPAN